MSARRMTPPDARGLAHLCEHLMGEGSPKTKPQPQKVSLDWIGGTSAHWGVTDVDITHYPATVPGAQLETMLWLESDRMAAPLSRAARGPILRTQRDVVKQERHTGYTRPPIVWNRREPGHCRAALFPDGHPYQPRSDRCERRARCHDAGGCDVVPRPYYVPNNAVIR